MTDEQKLEEFTQSAYLIRNGQFFDDMDTQDGTDLINQTIVFANLLIDDLELEADWLWVRQRDKELGTISAATDTFPLPFDARKLLVNQYRSLRIQQDGTTVSEWDVVAPDLITDPDYASVGPRVTVVNRTLYFSRDFTDEEIGGTVVADVINTIPRLSHTNTKALALIKPLSLLHLGVANKMTLPDIVQGGLSPAFGQQYAESLRLAKADYAMSGTSATFKTQDLSGIGGLY